MSDQIEVGDLVVVVHWHPCGCGLGHIRRVLSFRESRNPTQSCRSCNGPRISQLLPSIRAVSDGGRECPISWLRKIPPFPELADEKADDRIPELVLK